MNKIQKYFKIAKSIAKMGDSNNIHRKYRIGSIGIRGKDGVMVFASNLVTPVPNYRVHSESRLCEMLSYDSTIYVVRIDAINNFRNAKPCQNCLRKMRLKKVKRCYYTISNNEYGVINFT